MKAGRNGPDGKAGKRRPGGKAGKRNGGRQGAKAAHAGAGKGGKHARKPGRGGAKQARPFRKGDLRLILLAMIAPAPTHGYELIKSIEERLGGGYSPSPGVIYPTLALLEDIGLVEGTADGAKKLYGITAAGSAHLAEQADAMPAIEARMNAFGAATNGGRAAPVLEAMEALRLAIRDRATAGVLTEEQIGQIQAVLNEGAAAIAKV